MEEIGDNVKADAKTQLNRDIEDVRQKAAALQKALAKHKNTLTGRVLAPVSMAADLAVEELQYIDQGLNATTIG